jgi:hypothetical protein
MNDVDMVEWQITITSNKCPYLLEIKNFKEKITGIQCDHPENDTRFCSKQYCPIINVSKIN